jgi:hypothetical protein
MIVVFPVIRDLGVVVVARRLTLPAFSVSQRRATRSVGIHTEQRDQTFEIAASA